MPITVRTRTDEDSPAVRDVVTQAFGDEGQVADLAEALRARPDLQRDLVAVTPDGRVVGHTHLSISWVDAPARLVEVLTLSPLAVDPAEQKRGIGARLLDAALADAAQLGVPLVFLEGDPRYYGRHGWQPAGPLGFTAPSERIPPAAFQVTPLARYDPASMSGALVYNDTFWRFDRVGLRRAAERREGPRRPGGARRVAPPDL